MFLAAGESLLATCLSIYHPYHFGTVLPNGTPWYSFLLVFLFFFILPPVTIKIELKPQCSLVVQSESGTDVLYVSESCAEHNSYLMTCLDLEQDICRP